MLAHQKLIVWKSYDSLATTEVEIQDEVGHTDLSELHLALIIVIHP